MVNQPLIYGAWGVAWLIGCGAMWLSVLGQHPFRGAAGWASAVLGAGIALAIVATGIATGRASRGVLVIVGLIYRVAAGMWLDLVMFWLGVRELVAAIGAWTGPVGVLLMDAVAGGGGFLAASALAAWRNRS